MCFSFFCWDELEELKVESHIAELAYCRIAKLPQD